MTGACLPQYVGVLSSGPQNGTLFGYGDLTEIIKMKGLLAWLSSVLTGVFIKKWKSEPREDVAEKPTREF